MLFLGQDSVSRASSLHPNFAASLREGKGSPETRKSSPLLTGWSVAYEYTTRTVPLVQSWSRLAFPIDSGFGSAEARDQAVTRPPHSKNVTSNNHIDVCVVRRQAVRCTYMASRAFLVCHLGQIIFAPNPFQYLLTLDLSGQTAALRFVPFDEAELSHLALPDIRCPSPLHMLHSTSSRLGGVRCQYLT